MPASATAKTATAVAAAADFTSQCAVLLRGGVHATRAMQLTVAELQSGPSPGELAQINTQLAHGATAAEALTRVAHAPEWRLLAAAWSLAEHSGAPLAPALDRIAGSLRALSQMHERRRALLTGPRVTVRMVASLPPLALLLGGALGFDPIPVLLSPTGAVLLALGTALLYAGVRWARAMNRAVEARDRVAGLEFELAWIAMSGGAGPGEALLRVANCISDHRVTWASLDELRLDRPLRRTLDAASRAGVPVAPLLLEEAAMARSRVIHELESDAERLGVRVLIPLGVCVLPAFIVLGVLPVLFSMLGDLS